MGISDFIQRKKEELFLYRDSDKLALQKANLMKERIALQERRNLENEVKKEQQQIRDLRAQPGKERRAVLSQRLSNVKKGLKNLNTQVGSIGTEKSQSPFRPDSNPFGRDDKPTPKKKISKPRSITIRLQE